MATFIPAQRLKQSYEVFGHFYSLNVPSLEPALCRSVLEIASIGDRQRIEADAVFVMMNPGSSRPVEERDHLVESGRVSAMAIRLVPTVPDTTQYQIMRVMYFVGWRHVRVINLSDLREAKSNSFFKYYSRLEQENGCEVHSVFSPVRSKELQRYLVRKSRGPIVCAWGVSDSLDPLITRATTALQAEPWVTGLEKPGHRGKYFHPLPSLQRQKEQWVTQMLESLQVSCAASWATRSSAWPCGLR